MVRTPSVCQHQGINFYWLHSSHLYVCHLVSVCLLSVGLPLPPPPSSSLPHFLLLLQLWYGQMDEADILIEELCRDKVSITIQQTTINKKSIKKELETSQEYIANLVLYMIGFGSHSKHSKLINHHLKLAVRYLHILFVAGSTAQKKRHVHSGYGLLWLGKQRSYQKITARCCKIYHCISVQWSLEDVSL